jgi:hypothetical protein
MKCDYNTELLSIEHYKHHPQMVPFIGENWGKNKKLLIVGESHFSENAPNDNFIINWYERKKQDFSKEIIQDTSTVDIIEEGIKNEFNFRHNRIYSEINMVIKSIDDKLDITYYSFMNFFQRPAKNKNEHFNKIDDAIGNITLKKVINIIQPEYLFFLSSRAWEGFSIDYDNEKIVQLYNEDKIGYSCHPTCSWWNRESKENSYSKKNKENIAGKAAFKNFIELIQFQN